MTRSDGLLGAAAALSIAGLGVALYSQHVLGMQPCAWCVLQRLVYCLIAAAAIVGLIWRSPVGRRLGAGLVVLLAICGVGAALWQYFVAASSASCDLSLAERIVGATGLDERFPTVFMALASCAEASVKLLGVPFPVWSLALFVVLAVLGARTLRRRA